MGAASPFLLFTFCLDGQRLRGEGATGQRPAGARASQTSSKDGEQTVTMGRAGSWRAGRGASPNTWGQGGRAGEKLFGKLITQASTGK